MKIEIKNKSERLISIPLMVILGVVTIVHLSITYLLSQRLSQQVTDYESVVNHNIAMDKVILKRLEPVYIQLPNATKIKAIREDYTKPSSLWFYVSKQKSLPLDYTPNPIRVPDVSIRTDKDKDEMSVRSDIVNYLVDMFDDAKKASVFLMLGSGYRSIKQQTIYFNSLASSVGYEKANETIAVPGHSEHHTGLAVDLSSISRECYLSKCFKDTGDYKWLIENSYKYGFILRYPELKESITGYSYEPWHFRFVGKDLALAIHQSGLTFDEVQPYIFDALGTLKLNKSISN